MKNLMSKKLLIVLVASLVILSGITFVGINVVQKMNKITTCMVQFESSGGTKINFQEVEKGMQIIEPEPPTKEGFTFIEWQLKGDKFDFNSIITEDIILIAKWEANPETEICMVYFDTLGGTNINAIEVAKGSKINNPIQPKKNNYNFDGWYLDGALFDFETNIEQDIILVAKWAKIDKKTNDSTEKTQNENKTITHGSSASQKIEEAVVQVGYYDNIGWTWSTGIMYSPEYSYVTYKSSDNNIATISSTGFISAIAPGTAYIYAYIIERETGNIEATFTGKLIVEEQITGNTEQNDETKPKIPFSEIGGTWYLDGSRLAKIIIEEDMFRTEYIDSETFETFPADYSGGGSINLAYFEKEYSAKISGGYLYLTKGGKTLKFKRSPSVVNAKEIKLNKNRITMNLGDTLDVSISVYPLDISDEAVYVSSSNTSVINLTNERLIPNTYAINHIDFWVSFSSIGYGETVLTFSSNGLETKCEVIVNKIDVTAISINKPSISLIIGNNERLYTTISPENAGNKNVIWSSSNPEIASVDSNGVISGKGVGIATITATSEDGGHTASCNVTVNTPPLALDGSIGYSTRVTENSVSTGMVVTAKPSGGTGVYTYNIKLYYEGSLIGEGTSNELFVNQSSNGTYSATITVTDSNGETKTITKSITKS